MTAIGWQGILVVGLVLLLVLAPRQLPKIARSLGETARELRDSIGKD